MTVNPDRQKEAVERNYEAFRKLLPELLLTHRGKFALMRDGSAIEFFDTAGDAAIFGARQYPDLLFSVQEVSNASVDLGYFSHAVHHASV
jgi:hypothetical protein